MTHIFLSKHKYACKRTCYRAYEFNFNKDLQACSSSKKYLALAYAFQMGPKQKQRFCFQYFDYAMSNMLEGVLECGKLLWDFMEAKERYDVDRDCMKTLCHLLAVSGNCEIKENCLNPLPITKDKLPDYIMANALCYLNNIVDALAFLHRSGYAHRDIKPQNVLLFRGNPDCECLPFFCTHVKENAIYAKLADFDLVDTTTSAGLYLGKRECGTQGYRGLEWKLHTFPRELVMSTDEVAGVGSIGNATDIWALGCTVIKIFLGYPGPSTYWDYLCIAAAMQGFPLPDEDKNLFEKPGFFPHSDTFEYPDTYPPHRIALANREGLWRKAFIATNLDKLIKHFPEAFNMHTFYALCLTPDPNMRPSAQELKEGKISEYRDKGLISPEDRKAYILRFFDMLVEGSKPPGPANGKKEAIFDPQRNLDNIIFLSQEVLQT